MQIARMRSPEETYGPALDKARADLSRMVPAEIQARAGVAYKRLDMESGRFRVPYLGDLHEVSWPAGAVWDAGGHAADVVTQLLVLHYLLNADGEPPADRWVSFRELPGGLGYMPAFQARTAQRLVRAFGANKQALEAAALSLGGERLIFGDASFSFCALPNLCLAVILHVADEEFPAEVNVLFDGTAAHYLPTEDLAVLGGSLAGRLIRAAKAR